MRILFFTRKVKADSTPEAAIRQIKEREYAQKLKREGVSRILLVGISYDTARKEHRCSIQEDAAGTAGD